MTMRICIGRIALGVGLLAAVLARPGWGYHQNSKAKTKNTTTTPKKPRILSTHKGLTLVWNKNGLVVVFNSGANERILSLSLLKTWPDAVELAKKAIDGGEINAKQVSREIATIEDGILSPENIDEIHDILNGHEDDRAKLPKEFEGSIILVHRTALSPEERRSSKFHGTKASGGNKIVGGANHDRGTGLDERSAQILTEARYLRHQSVISEGKVLESGALNEALEELGMGRDKKVNNGRESKRETTNPEYGYFIPEDIDAKTYTEMVDKYHEFVGGGASRAMALNSLRMLFPKVHVEAVLEAAQNLAVEYVEAKKSNP